jgi:4-hydroxy-2-oxoheptanedioate aldolase
VRSKHLCSREFTHHASRITKEENRVRENAVKARLRRGEVVYGILSPNYDTMLVETLGMLGFSTYMLDCEHGPAGPLQTLEVVRACETVGMTPLARVRSADPKLLLQFLDVGVMGVMMPSVMGVDDVKRLVEAVRYPPVGRRGIAPVRANDYLLAGMPQAEYVAFANEQIIIMPQIETVEALQALDDLVRVEGVDGYFVGPRDLAMSMGFADGPAHDELRQARARVFETVRAAGLITGTVASTGQDAQALAEAGAQLLLTSVNNLLKVGASAFFAR